MGYFDGSQLQIDFQQYLTAENSPFLKNPELCKKILLSAADINKIAERHPHLSIVEAIDRHTKNLEKDQEEDKFYIFSAFLATLRGFVITFPSSSLSIDKSESSRGGAQTYSEMLADLLRPIINESLPR